MGMMFLPQYMSVYEEEEWKADDKALDHSRCAIFPMTDKDRTGVYLSGKQWPHSGQEPWPGE